MMFQEALQSESVFFQEKIVIHGENDRVETSLIFATEEFMKILFSLNHEDH